MLKIGERGRDNLLIALKSITKSGRFTVWALIIGGVACMSLILILLMFPQQHYAESFHSFKFSWIWLTIMLPIK